MSRNLKTPYPWQSTSTSTSTYLPWRHSLTLSIRKCVKKKKKFITTLSVIVRKINK